MIEKKVADRVQTVLCDPVLLKVFEAFGGEVFRRSSVFHGLGKFLVDRNLSGRVCFEIGTWAGLTAVVLSRHFERVITVDIVNNPVKHAIIEHLGIKNVRCLNIADNDDKRRAAETWDFDFAFMDGDHAHDTESDFALVKKSRRVLFQEAWPFQPPVWGLVQSLPREQVTYGGDGLAFWDGNLPLIEAPASS